MSAPRNSARCPGCGLELPRGEAARVATPAASAECLGLYDALAFYTLGKGDGFFIHQVIVDAYAAQHASEDSPPMRTAFGVIGLYLFFKRGFSGRQVQRAHQMLAEVTKVWPSLGRPPHAVLLTVRDVLAAPEGPLRDDAIHSWAKAVWAGWEPLEPTISELASKLGTRVHGV